MHDEVLPFLCRTLGPVHIWCHIGKGFCRCKEGCRPWGRQIILDYLGGPNPITWSPKSRECSPAKVQEMKQQGKSVWFKVWEGLTYHCWWVAAWTAWEGMWAASKCKGNLSPTTTRNQICPMNESENKFISLEPLQEGIQPGLHLHFSFESVEAKDLGESNYSWTSHFLNCEVTSGCHSKSLYWQRFFFLFRAIPVAYGSSLTRGQIRSVAASPYYSSWQCRILNLLSEWGQGLNPHLHGY